MAATIFRLLLVAAVARCRGDTGGMQKRNGQASQLGELLKPPPLPLKSIVPVPFHGGATRTQRQNVDTGYHYPPPPPPPPIASNELKFPAPFYKQYNFNFVPPPQPFTSTPSPSLFQKVSGWLFPPQSSRYAAPTGYPSTNLAPVKKDCNPCNLVPWIPVIKYNLGAKQLQQDAPTYGPPSSFADVQSVPQYQLQNFQYQKLPQSGPGVPHAVYGPPVQSFTSPSSTYGPPSPTHILTAPSPSPPSSTYSIDTSSFAIQTSSFGVPSSSLGHFSTSNNLPSLTYGSPNSVSTLPLSSYGVPNSSYGLPSTTYGAPSLNYGTTSSTYGTPTSTYATPSPTYQSPQTVTTSFEPITPDYLSTILNNRLPQNNAIGFKNTELSNELQLPKITSPAGFKNSYGEPITSTYAFGIPYPVSATAAESTKVNTEILPHDSKRGATPNMSLALSNPAPFTLNRGRNIHTLQPVALPNLSVSPLPPIFNARPFKPVTAANWNENLIKGLNYMQLKPNNINIEQSVPVTEFTQSVDIQALRNYNQTKSYRTIQNSLILNEIRDVSSQASEDHAAASSTSPDSSFESTGAEYGNDLYENGIPSQFGAKIPSNHKSGFADLRGVNDEEVDKYRSENNLQNIDSPLLYLRPGIPHKEFENFVIAVTTPSNENDYEIYDEIPTTPAPISTQISSWDESRNDYSEGLLPPPELHKDEDKPKIVQIIVPYTTGEHNSQSNSNDEQRWPHTPEDEYKARKVPSNTENPYNIVTENYSTASPYTEQPETESYDSDNLNPHAILNDLYDVKEPPFDIIKLQQTIDDWTEQEYSKHYKVPQRTRTSAKYAKQIPDEYFTTLSPITNYVTAASNYNYDIYDHEVSSSELHSVTEEKNETISKPPRKEYNNIERPKVKHESGKHEEAEEKRPHIYTAASSFRSTTTTPAPWETIQTSISPLTKEKVYVVTSKPWLVNNGQSNWYSLDFESKKLPLDSDTSASDQLPFKSPRFSNRPSFGFTSSGSGKFESLKMDPSYGLADSWHQSINELEGPSQNKTSTSLTRGPETTTNSEDNVPNTEEATTSTMITTAELLEESANTKSLNLKNS